MRDFVEFTPKAELSRILDDDMYETESQRTLISGLGFRTYVNGCCYGDDVSSKCKVAQYTFQNLSTAAGE